MRKSVQPIMALPDATDKWWLATGEINWIHEAFPEEIKLIWCDDSGQEDISEEYEEITLSEEEFYGSEIDRDAADNDFLLWWVLATIFISYYCVQLSCGLDFQLLFSYGSHV